EDGDRARRRRADIVQRVVREGRMTDNRATFGGVLWEFAIAYGRGVRYLVLVIAVPLAAIIIGEALGMWGAEDAIGAIIGGIVSAVIVAGIVAMLVGVIVGWWQMLR